MIVYMHRNKINGKIYIGQTMYQDNPELRWGKNGEGYYRNELFAPDIFKYGWDNFEHIILAKDLNRNEAITLEKYYIRKYRTDEEKYGYNRSFSARSCLRGKIAVHKGLVNKFIEKKDLQKYLDDGWLEGGWKQEDLEKIGY